MEINNQCIARNAGRPIMMDGRFHEGTRPLIVFCHGFKGFKDWGCWNLMGEKLFQAGFHFVKFNFSHNGGTEEEVIDFPDLEAFAQNSYSKEVEDLNTLLDHMIMNFSGRIEHIVLIGHSRGGAIATLVAGSRSEVKKLITMAAVSDLKARMRQYNIEEWRVEGRVFLPNARTGQQMPLDYGFYEDLVRNEEMLDVLSAARSFQGDSLVIHAADDPVVSIADAHALIDAFDSAEGFVLEEGGHTFGTSHPCKMEELSGPFLEVLERIEAFLQG